MVPRPQRAPKQNGLTPPPPSFRIPRGLSMCPGRGPALALPDCSKEGRRWRDCWCRSPLLAQRCTSGLTSHVAVEYRLESKNVTINVRFSHYAPHSGALARGAWGRGFGFVGATVLTTPILGRHYPAGTELGPQMMPRTIAAWLCAAGFTLRRYRIWCRG
jgi:hypothetical protein